MRKIGIVTVLAILFAILNDGNVVAQSANSSNATVLNQAQKIDVFISSPGLLKNLIENARAQEVQSLRNIMVKGEMNFEDLRFLATLSSLFRLDLSEVRILGKTFHSDNSFPSDVFKETNSNIKELILPKGLISIEPLAFVGLEKLQKIEISDKCRIIGEGAFKGTTSLCAISLPDSLLVISDYAFYASGIKVISIPQNVKLIGKGAFQKSQLIYFSSQNVKACTILNDNLLADCQDLKFASFHKNVKVIGRDIFANDLKLERVEFKSLLPPYLLDKKKFGLQEKEILVPKSSAQLYMKKTPWKNLKKNLIFTDNLVGIDIDRLQKTELARIDSTNMNLHFDIAEKGISDGVIPKMQGELMLLHTDSVMTGREKKGNPVPIEFSVPRGMTTKSIVKLELPSKIIDSELKYKVDLPIVKQRDFPTKVYWLDGKLYVEASKTIKVANLMTLDGVYIYGKAESEYIWSFKINKAKVASVRISYDNLDVPELIKMQ
jgi:hypothetical protein